MAPPVNSLSATSTILLFFDLLCQPVREFSHWLILCLGFPIQLINRNSTVTYHRFMRRFYHFLHFQLRGDEPTAPRLLYDIFNLHQRQYLIRNISGICGRVDRQIINRRIGLKTKIPELHISPGIFLFSNILHITVPKITLSLSLLSDSNQRPRDYKSRALAN